jgi:hypothetical protein
VLLVNLSVSKLVEMSLLAQIVCHVLPAQHVMVRTSQLAHPVLSVRAELQHVNLVRQGLFSPISKRHPLPRVCHVKKAARVDREPLSARPKMNADQDFTSLLKVVKPLARFVLRGLIARMGKTYFHALPELLMVRKVKLPARIALQEDSVVKKAKQRVCCALRENFKTYQAKLRALIVNWEQQTVRWGKHHVPHVLLAVSVIQLAR